MALLGQSLSEISSLKLNDDESTEGLLDAVIAYEKRLKGDKETVQTKRDKLNDSLKEIGSFIQIKTNEIKK